MESRIKDYLNAEGPEGLSLALNELLEKSKKDPFFAKKEHYVLYQLGQQKSLIKIDTTKMPFRFWHYDLMGRPMTNVVKEVISNFLWEKCGGKSSYQAESRGFTG